MGQPTRSQVTRPLTRAGFTPARPRPGRIQGLREHSPGFRVEMHKGEPHVLVGHSLGFARGDCAPMLHRYAEALRAAGLDVVVNETYQRLEVTSPE